MISLKKYLEMNPDERKASQEDAGELLSAILEAYRAALLAMGTSAVQACPPTGNDLQPSLADLASRLANGPTSSLVKDTEGQSKEQIEQWGTRTAEYFKARTAEIKELLIVVARTAESVGARDQRYSEQIGQFTTRLKTISNLEDLTQVRASLVKEAIELKTYVDQMEDDSHKLVAQLQTEVSTYETKLKAVEELASRDSLTGLANRRNVEERIESRIARKQIFCVALLDINKLKIINDKHGHLAGDSLLQQFAQELRSASRSTDLVGRWGGDEFIVVIESDLEGAKTQVDRLRKWVFGEYTIRPGKGNGEVKVTVDAAVGIAPWSDGQILKDLIERADSEMYRQKQLARKHHA